MNVCMCIQRLETNRPEQPFQISMGTHRLSHPGLLPCLSLSTDILLSTVHSLSGEVSGYRGRRSV